MTGDQFLLIVAGGAVVAALWTMVDAYRSTVIDEVKQQAPDVAQFHEGWDDDFDGEAWERSWLDDPAVRVDAEIAYLNEQYGWFEMDETPLVLRVLARRAAKSNRAA
jgi:hypothetical protein